MREPLKKMDGGLVLQIDRASTVVPNVSISQPVVLANEYRKPSQRQEEMQMHYINI